MTPSQRNGAIAAVLATFAALMAGTAIVQIVTPTPGETGTGTHTRASTLAPPGSTCFDYDAVSPSALTDMMKLAPGTHWGIVRICGPDAEAAPGSLPSGLTSVEGTERPATYVEGVSRTLEIWSIEDPDAPAECACRAGADCEVERQPMGGALRWEPAPPMQRFARPFRGRDCHPAPCVGLAGHPDPMPAACKPPVPEVP